MSLNALNAHRWSGAVLRSLSQDLETRTVVLELHPSALDTGLCLRIVITNCRSTVTGQLTGEGTESRRLIHEPLVPAEPTVIARDGVLADAPDFTSAVFATSGGRLEVVGGIASVDEFAVEAADAPLTADDLAVLDQWRRAA